MVTILMAYKSGPKRMLEVAVCALMRYKAGCPFQLRIITDSSDKKAEQEVYFEHYLHQYDIGEAASGSGNHGRLLDAALKEVDSEFFLTLDSDCFPVADGWLKDLVDMQGENVAAAGILWPWIPAPDSEKETLESRIRGYHCSNNTHPACQLIRTKMFKDNGWKFADPDGDDTNHGFMKKAHLAGMVVKGWMPTRCPIPDFEFDPEFNRHECLVFGDKVYHHVGATTELGKDASILRVFTKARDRVYNESGAEWLLADSNSYQYKFDREEEVAQFKMKLMFEAAREYLKTHDSMFGRGWA